LEVSLEDARILVGLVLLGVLMALPTTTRADSVVLRLDGVVFADPRNAVRSDAGRLGILGLPRDDLGFGAAG
jgi:hypothetical protein